MTISDDSLSLSDSRDPHEGRKNNCCCRKGYSRAIADTTIMNLNPLAACSSSNCGLMPSHNLALSLPVLGGKVLSILCRQLRFNAVFHRASGLERAVLSNET